MAKKVPQAAAASQLQSSSHQVGHERAVKMVKQYQKVRKALLAAHKSGSTMPASLPELGLSYSFNAASIRKLLKKPGAAGIRIYPAVNEANQLTMVLVAFDEAGNNINTPPAVSTKAGASAKSKAGPGMALKNTENDGNTLDDSQINPPYSAPPTP
jgi:hypothetical protein